jgi:hypothetical protein
MNKLWPTEDKNYFAYHFLQPLPKEACILLSQEPVSNMQVLAKKADGITALHQPQ